MKQLLPACALSLFVSSAAAQTVVWSDDFSDPGNWVLAHDGPVALDWQIGVGLVNTGDFVTEPVQSTTAANGYAMLDSDGFSNATTDQESSHMTTAVPIDLSACPNPVLRFETNFRNYAPTRCFVVVSTTNTDWPALTANAGPSTNVFPLFADIGFNQGTENPRTVLVDIGGAVSGASTVWVRFHWTGLYGYSWFVDDVAVLDEPALPCTAEYIVTQSTDAGTPVPFDLTIYNTSYGGSGTYTYLWDFGDGTTSTSPAPVHTFTGFGPYTICLTIDDGAGCTSQFCDDIWVDTDGLFNRDGEGGSGFTVHIVPNISTAVADAEVEQERALWPNPVVDVLNVDVDDRGTMPIGIRITDLGGRTLSRERAPAKNGTVQLDVSRLNAGTYLLRTEVANAVRTIPFVKAP